mgnify:FL=1|jgi:hypothetical protein
MLATRGVKIRPLAFGPDFVQGASARGAVPECNIGHIVMCEYVSYSGSR